MQNSALLHVCFLEVRDGQRSPVHCQHLGLRMLKIMNTAANVVGTATAGERSECRRADRLPQFQRHLYFLNY